MEINFNKGNYKRSDINCKIWTEYQIELLKLAYKQYGSNWVQISEKFFPDRNANQLKCKFNYLMRQMKQKQDIDTRVNIDEILKNTKKEETQPTEKQDINYSQVKQIHDLVQQNQQKTIQCINQQIYNHQFQQFSQQFSFLQYQNNISQFNDNAKLKQTHEQQLNQKQK
ncbi:Myb-like_DNA-binding domain-containing protein [Hexamita inflata]|uniref:Myb-like DNA-binding domain-containing protein n=1 Tax=Hexamita inflata TaxID=28002 RepID=A0AA86NQY3_9EUKA|nr:Myb-like DNA-binding domain-containing protein [Hexamita inflata]CAI9953087.1 Myb-like DNA-binding domain-containing protein [Hexamita inflata]